MSDFQAAALPQTAPDRSSQRTATVLLVFMAASAVFLDYWEYSKSSYAEPGIWNSLLNGTASAPAQYRVGVVRTADFLARHGHFEMRHALGIIDFCALITTIFILRAVITRSSIWRSSTPAAQWFGYAVFILLLQYSLAWLLWFQRPETLSAAALLALSFYITAFGLPVKGTGGRLLTAFSLIALGFLQGITRADTGFAFHLGVAIACFFISDAVSDRDSNPLFSPPLGRTAQGLISFMAAGAAAAVQIYLVKVAYPNAVYGPGPKIHLRYNITHPLRLLPFLLFLLPTVWTFVQATRQRLKLSRAETGLLIGAAIFFVMWCVFGKIDEVRIFLPFALALTPLAVTIAMARLRALANLAQDTGSRDTVS